VVEARVLDLYAGSGSLGIEALSRKASSVVFVERSRPALSALHSNLRSVGVTDQTSVAPRDVERFVAGRQTGTRFDIVFADPPWDISSGRLAGILSRVARWMAPGAVAVITRRAGDVVPVVDGLEVADQRRHGDAEIIRYRKDET
jgi:16S rRNA (guanine966-N2)-methyltransferase